jgi:hypothetical protein
MECLYIFYMNIVVCRLKACISESEQTPIARQGYRQLNAFTRQRVNSRPLPRGKKTLKVVSAVTNMLAAVV